MDWVYRQPFDHRFREGLHLTLYPAAGAGETITITRAVWDLDGLQQSSSVLSTLLPTKVVWPVWSAKALKIVDALKPVKAVFNWIGQVLQVNTLSTITKEIFNWTGQSDNIVSIINPTKRVWPTWSGKALQVNSLSNIVKAVWNWTGRIFTLIEGAGTPFTGNLSKLDMIRTTRRRIGFEETNIERDFPGDGQE